MRLVWILLSALSSWLVSELGGLASRWSSLIAALSCWFETSDVDEFESFDGDAATSCGEGVAGLAAVAPPPCDESDVADELAADEAEPLLRKVNDGLGEGPVWLAAAGLVCCWSCCCW